MLSLPSNVRLDRVEAGMQKLVQIVDCLDVPAYKSAFGF
jgi:hypothetical protein